MRAGFLPKLLFSPSVLLVLVCVYGYIMFTVYLSFTTSTMMPAYELAGSGQLPPPARAGELAGLGRATWRSSRALYIVVCGRARAWASRS